jgi:serine/threonine protein kinase
VRYRRRLSKHVYFRKEVDATTTLGEPEWLRKTPPAGPKHAAVPLGSQYVLDYVVGQGAFGKVWYGRRNDDGSPVAIKVPQANYSSDPEVVARFLRERSALQALSHPHLVTVYDLVVEGDTLAVVMEFVHGRDLRTLARRGGLGMDDTLTALTQVASALDYIHAAGVLHRDIKPENILMTRRRGQPWAQLTDFGLAWVADGKRLTATSNVVGTPAYLAPELLTGRAYGAPVDVYSLGVTAYELLGGRRPFDADHPLALMRAHLDDQPKRPARMREDHWRIIRACLAKRPQDRPSAAELATRLDGLRTASGERPVIDLGAVNTVPPGRQRRDSRDGVVPPPSGGRGMGPVHPVVVPDPWSGDRWATGRREDSRSFGRPRRMRRALPVASAGVVLVLLTAVGYGAYRFGPTSGVFGTAGRCGYKIATLGSTPSPGPAIRSAATLAVKRYNDVHPNCTVTLVPFDTGTDSALSQSRATDIVADRKILGVVGPLGQREAFGALPVLDRGGVPVISPLLHEDRLATMGWRVFHRTSGTILGDDTPAGVRYLTKTLRAKRTFVVGEDDDDSKDVVAQARRLLGPAYAGSASAASPDIDFGPIVDQVVRSGADSVYYAGFTEVIVPLVQKLRGAKPDITVLSGYWGFDDSTIGALGKAGAGIYSTTPATPLSQAGGGLADQLRSSGTDVGEDDDAPEAFDAANILLAGIGAGRTDRAAMLAWVNGYRNTGVSGPIAFNANGDRNAAPVYVARSVNGNWKTIGRVADDRQPG